jgi:hypothetical protein
MANIDKRIEFLANQFKVYMDDEIDDICENLETKGYTVSRIDSEEYDEMSGVSDRRNIAITYSVVKNKEKGFVTTKTMIHESIFADMIDADPTPNKIYLQWMLNVFSKLLKTNRIDDAIRFGAEDLPLANEYLELFDGNKRKNLFMELSKTNYAIKNLKDPTNINQYDSLSQLFDAVDPFIEKEPSELERAMKRFVDSGQAHMPVKDRKYTLFIPLTRDANVLFDKFAGWCTAKRGNGMFSNYTNYKTPISDNSKIYIIIDNKFLEGEYDEASLPNEVMYQIHFESKQIRDRSNGRNRAIYADVISKSDALANFFYEELKPMAKAYTGSVKKNMYIDYLIEFGFSDILFDMLDVNTPAIRFEGREIPKIPSLKKFENVEYLMLGNIGMTELTSSIGSLKKLSILSIPENSITSLPKEIGQCKKLEFINLLDNEITDIPDEITQLDRTNGGMLHRISVRKKDIGEENFKKLQKLLPKVELTDKDN